MCIVKFTPNVNEIIFVLYFRRGGEPTEFVISCIPNGRAGDFYGDLVINLPEDNSKICFKVHAKSY